MDKLDRYRSIIKNSLTNRAKLMRSQPLEGEEIVCILDEATDNYLVLRLGWIRGKRLNSTTLHLRMLNDKISIEQDWTDDFISELTNEGICREDIIFPNTTPPELSSYSKFPVLESV